MKRLLLVAVSMVLVSAFFATPVLPVNAKGPKVLKFNSMVGVPVGLTGAASQGPLRGINGGGAPWTVGEASGELRANGHLEISVQGLVLTNTGSNPAAVFRGLVSCITSTGSVQNALTDPFPATTGLATEGGGNAEIVADLVIPQPCIAPIIFVTNNGGSWFAATGL